MPHWGWEGVGIFASPHGFCKREMGEFIPLLLTKKSYTTGPNSDAIQLLLWVCPKFGSFDLERVKKLERLNFELGVCPLINRTSSISPSPLNAIVCLNCTLTQPFFTLG